MDAAVLVAKDTFMSRVEKAAPCSEKGEKGEKGEDNLEGCEEDKQASAGGVDWNGDGDRWLTRR